MTTTEQTAAPTEDRPEQLATKRDLDNAITHLRGEFAVLRGEFAVLRTDLHQDMRDLRLEMREHRKETTATIEKPHTDITDAADKLSARLDKFELQMILGIVVFTTVMGTIIITVQFLFA